MRGSSGGLLLVAMVMPPAPLLPVSEQHPLQGASHREGSICQAGRRLAEGRTELHGGVKLHLSLLAFPFRIPVAATFQRLQAGPHRGGLGAREQTRLLLLRAGPSSGPPACNEVLPVSGAVGDLL